MNARKLFIAFAAIALLFGFEISGFCSPDLIVNYTTVTVGGGDYGKIIVTNHGVLTVNGSITAENIVVDSTGTFRGAYTVRAKDLKVSGYLSAEVSLSASNMVVYPSGIVFVGRTNNIFENATVFGRVMGCGLWKFNRLDLVNGSTFAVLVSDYAYPNSGILNIKARILNLEQGATIDGFGTGDGVRGNAGDQYSGAGHAGYGGRGFGSMDSDRGGPYGDPWSYEVKMGSRTMYSYGGGGVSIEASELLTVNGVIDCRADPAIITSSGGGSGGGILLYAPNLELNGQLLANGGDGLYNGGGGSGGRIKLFIGNTNFPTDTLYAHLSVKGGSAGTTPGACSGENGTAILDFIPRVESILSPEDSASVTNGNIRFRLKLDDMLSVQQSSEFLNPRIELSTNGFASVCQVFDCQNSIEGWDKSVYYDGDVAEFAVPVELPPGTYQWRARISDGIVWSSYSEPRTLVVNAIVPTQLKLDIMLTPTIVIHGRPGLYRILFVSDPESSDWQELDSVRTTSDPSYYFDVSATNQTRYYRAVLVE